MSGTVLCSLNMLYNPIFSVQFSHSVVSNSLQPHGLQHTRLPCPSNSRSLLKLMSIESVMSSSHLILCHPLLLLPSIVLSIRVFSSESVLCIRWPKYWSTEVKITLLFMYGGIAAQKKASRSHSKSL